MNETVSYMMLIESLRKRKHLSIHDLTDGLMSTKTYHRYKTGKNAVSINTISRLVLKMNADIIDLLYYHIRYFDDNIRLESYILGMLVGEDDSVHKAYRKLRQNIADEYDKRICIELLYHKYLHQTNMMTDEEYSIYVMLRDLELKDRRNNLYTLLCKLICCIGLGGAEVDKCTWFLKEYQKPDLYKQKVPLYLASLDYLLGGAMTFGYSDMDLYQQTLDCFKRVAEVYESKNSVYQALMYQAYIHYKKGEMEKYEDALFQHLNYRQFILNSSYMIKSLEFIKNVFNVDPKTFLQAYIEKKLVKKEK